jgi:hypothetical protein
MSLATSLPVGVVGHAHWSRSNIDENVSFRRFALVSSDHARKILIVIATQNSIVVYTAKTFCFLLENG